MLHLLTCPELVLVLGVGRVAHLTVQLLIAYSFFLCLCSTCNMSNCRPIEVPMQSYAGKLLIIDQLVLPLNPEELKQKPPAGKKTTGSTLADMLRPSYFDSEVIEKTLITYCTLEGIAKQFKNDLVEGMLAAIETYMKYMIKSVIELSEHRSGNSLINDPRCIVQHNMRTTLMFLNDREVADYGCSDDDSGFGHRR